MANADILTASTPESIYKQSRILADVDETAYNQLMREEDPKEEPEKPELPGLAQGLSNALDDLNPTSALKGFVSSVGRDTLHGIRALFSPGESISAAVLSQFHGDQDDSAYEAAADAMYSAITNQPGRDLAAEVAEYQFPNQGKMARAATELGLSLASDPLTYAGAGLLPALRKGIRRVGTGKSLGPLTGAVDDLVETIAPKNADQLYDLARKAEGGDKGAVKQFTKLMGEHAGQWELQAVGRDYHRLTTVGGEGKTIPVAVSRVQKTLQAKRINGDPALFMKELDAPVTNPFRFNELHLNINSPEDVLGLGRVYEHETSKYVEAALKKFPENTIEDGILRGSLKEQHALLADALGDVVNRKLTDVQAFSYRRLLADIGDNVLTQVNKSEMKFRSNVDRLRFYKLVGVREQLRAELSLSKNPASSLLSKLTTASDVKAIKVVQADRAINKIPEILNGQEERYLEKGLANLENGDQVSVFLNQVFSPGSGLKNLEENIHTYWVNSILSGPVTQGRNAIVNGLNVLLKPVEHTAVGDFAAARQQAIGMVEGTMDVFRVMANRAPKQAINYADYRHMHELSANAPRLSNSALRQLSPFEQGWHFVTTNIIGGPTKLLGEADAIFKSIAQRQDIRGQAVNLASRMTEDSSVRKKLIQRFLRNPMQLMQQKSFVNSEKLTFQNPLPDKLTGLHQAVSRFPATKWITPFVKTPLNIATVGIRYTPYAALFKGIRNDIVKGGVEARLAISRMMVMPTATTALAFTMGDNITGGLTGHNTTNEYPPYSVNINGKWFSYRKVEPLRWTLGPAADLKDLYTAIDWDASDALTIWGQAISGVTGAYLKPTMDTLFLNSVADVMAAVADGADGNWGRLERLAQNYLGGMIPNIASQANRLFVDTEAKQLDNFMSTLKNRVPGLTKDLPPKVGFLGEHQEHTLDTKTSPVSTHRVYREMQHLGMAIPPVPRVINSHELNMYERAMFRIYRAAPPDGQSLAASYDQLFSAYEYKSATKEEKKEFIASVANDYNKVARGIILQQNQRLQEKAR